MTNVGDSKGGVRHCQALLLEENLRIAIKKVWWSDLEIQALLGGGVPTVEENLSLSSNRTSLTDIPVQVEMTKEQIYLLQRCIK